MTRGYRGSLLLVAAGMVAAGLVLVARSGAPVAAPDGALRPGDASRVVAHLRALQQIADEHDGTRASGTPGYAASRDYVVHVLERAGYHPAIQRFRFRDRTTGQVLTSWNVLAETRSGNRRHVVMAGAHLDSVPDGPGIDDNGTGSAALLDAAQDLAGTRTVNAVRFAWWGAEESGLAGSRAYVHVLPPTGLRDIAVYLNVDMIGSSNFVRLVYDGDNSRFPAGGSTLAGPDGSGAVEKMLHDYFADRGLASEESPLDGRSDYKPFLTRGVPVGGLFTGADGTKTEAEASAFGGRAGVGYDGCYHRACDDLADLDLDAVREMSAAVVYAVRHLAMTPDRPG